MEGSRSCHKRLRLRGLGKKTKGCISASEHLRGVAVLGKKKIEAKRGVAGEKEETKGRGLGQPGQEV